MKNIIIICEGQSEQIFIRKLIEKKLNLSMVSFRCLKLQGQKEEQAPYEYKSNNPSFNIIILNVQNDDRVLSVIKERYKILDNKYDLIIGLRDMYSENYPKTEADQKLNREIKNKIKKQIKTFDTNKKIRFFFMIMEFESWLLSLKKTIEEYVFEKSGEIPIIHSEPEKLFHPSHALKSIFGNYKISYGKHYSEVESILSFFQEDDLMAVLRERNSISFQLFLRYCFRYTKGILIE